MRHNLLFMGALGFTLLHGQALPPEQKQKVDDAVPAKAPAIPKRPRRMLVSNLEMRDGHPWRGSSYATLPAANYAIGEMGKRTGAYEAVFSDDVEMFRPDRIKQFDAICFLNTVGVLFEDPELKKSLLAFIAGGKGFVGIHDAIATFVQYPKYDQWPPFGQMLGATENGGHPWDGETMTVRVPISSPIRWLGGSAYSFRPKSVCSTNTVKRWEGCRGSAAWRGAAWPGLARPGRHGAAGQLAAFFTAGAGNRFGIFRLQTKSAILSESNAIAAVQTWLNLLILNDLIVHGYLFHFCAEDLLWNHRLADTDSNFCAALARSL